MPRTNLEELDSHFAFGKNWASYARSIGEPEIEEARRALLALLPAEAFRRASFLDIGCGSGVHALAASRLGVGRILAVDIDPDSVATTRKVLSSAATDLPWQAEVESVFNLDPLRQGRFDIVYSWGVLHHTGDMWKAIDKAAAMVAPGGFLVIALYRRTRLDAFWKLEKRLYSRAPRAVQSVMSAGYILLFRLAFALQRGVSFREYVRDYRSRRGMDFRHDVHDWLGGYPYESALAHEVESALTRKGLRAEKVLARALSMGWLGSGCDEYVYRLDK